MRSSTNGSQFAVTKSLLFGLIGIVTAFVFHFLPNPSVSAQIPEPIPFPCGRESFSDESSNPEFNTYRPYQSSPCNPEVEETALFCGNDVILQDTVQGTYDPFGGGNGNCHDIGNNKVQCDFVDQKTKNVFINLEDAEFPILGNTDDSKNALSDGTLDPATKLNEYVGWYLNGTNNNPAEGGPPEEDTLAENVINFSGPLRKLLPHRIKRDIISGSGELKGDHFDGTAQDALDGERHNQVVGCVDLGFGSDTIGEIIPCDEVSFPAAIIVRPGYFDEDNPVKGNPPPREEDFEDFEEWYLAYREWKGDICVDFGLGNICVDNPFSFRHIFNLYDSVPLSSTEDRKGQVNVETFNIQPYQEGVTITDVSHNIAPAELSFSHTEESVKLAKELQTTFAPKGQINDQPITNVSDPPDYAGCVVAEVRSNPGDDLFAGELQGQVNYTAEYSCIFDQIQEPDVKPPTPNCFQYGSPNANCYDDKWIGSSCRADYSGNGNIDDCQPGYFCAVDCKRYEYEEQTCEKTISINLSLITETPQADEVFERLVGGTSSVFKRIFPWIGVAGSSNTAGPIAAIVDIPGATSVTYSGDGVVNGKPELYFPHIGSVHEYFLECAQTTLRPKGFGEVCETGAPPPTGTSGGGASCPNVPDSAIDPKWLGQMKEHFIWAADSWASGDNAAEECYNYVVGKADSEGVNPAFALTIWLNETAASNYDHSGPTAQDFGINIPSLYQDLQGQLDFFLQLPYAANYLNCRDNPTNGGTWQEPMHAFLSRFRAGDAGCSTDNADGFEYYEHIKGFTWPLVVEPFGTSCLIGSSQGGTKFAINWPTDNSCP